jgi:hypothetical protein
MAIHHPSLTLSAAATTPGLVDVYENGRMPTSRKPHASGKTEKREHEPYAAEHSAGHWIRSSCIS